MAKVLVQEESLVTVADAIREKTGTTDALSFPTGFVDAVAAIQAGGGAKIETGTVVPAGTSTSITHNLGETPNVFFWFVTDFTNHNTTEDSGGYYVTAGSNSNTLCGGYINGISFCIRAGASNSQNFRYYVWPNNLDNYSRKIYRLTDTLITSNTDDLAYSNMGETVRWVAAVV